MLGFPTLLGRTIPQAGLVVDIGEQIDYLLVKNKSSDSGVRIAFDVIPALYTDPFFFPKDGGFDMGGLNIRYIYLRADVDLPSPVGMAIWLKADALTGLVDGDPVALWADSGLLARDATQANPANQPTYKAVALNGLPAVAFVSAGNQWLDFVNIPDITAVFWVAKLNTPPLGALAFWLGGTGRFYPGPNGLNTFMWDPPPTPPPVIPSQTDPLILTGVTQLNGVSVNGTTTDRSVVDFEIWSLRTAGPVAADSIANDALSANSSFMGDLCELIVFNTPVDATKAREIEAYLSRKYSVALTPVVSPVEVDVGGVQTRLDSLESTRGGAVRANNPYPFMIQLSEPLNSRRKMDTIPIPQRGIYCDWITNSMGGDAGDDSPINY